MKSRMLVCDVDGTLAESRQPISDEIKEELFKLANRREVCLITGGSYKLLKYQLGKVPEGVILHLMPTMGMHYVLLENKKATKIYSVSLKKKEKDKIIYAIKRLIKQFDLSKLASFEDQIDDRKTQISFSALGKDADLVEKKKFDPTANIRKSWIVFLSKYLPEYEIRIGGTTTLDFTRKGMDKGYGLRRLANFTGISLNKFLYIGDRIFEGGNDDAARRLNIDHYNVGGIAETLEVLKLL